MASKSKKPTNRDNLEACATRQLPKALQARLELVRSAINILKEEAHAWGVKREFTPDGRFLGDVGELIAKLYFGVNLTLKQEKGRDAMHAEVDAAAIAKGRAVEIKLRSRSTNIDFTGVPESVLVIYVSPETLNWGVVCNGPGADLLRTAKELRGNKFRTDCSRLMKAQEELGSGSFRLKQCVPEKPSNSD